MAREDAYTERQAADFSDAAEPFGLFSSWFADAEKHEPNDPNAMCVATVDATGMPNARMVLLKGFDDVGRGPDRGFVFYTNFESAKGREILAARKAALLFHWKSLRRQVRIRGDVGLVDAAEADAYFASRPRPTGPASASRRSKSNSGPTVRSASTTAWCSAGPTRTRHGTEIVSIPSVRS